MSKHSIKYWLLILTMAIPFALVACGSGSSIEDAVQEAAETVEEVAGDVADNAGEVVEKAEEVVGDAADAAGEMAEDAKEVVEDAMDGGEENAEGEMAEETHSDDDAMMEDDAMMAMKETYGDIDALLADGGLDGTVVTWWHNHSGSREEYLIGIVDDFNAKNEYGIVVEAINKGGYGDIYDAMIAGITTGDVPGLVVAYQNQAAAYQVADGLISLDPYIENATVGLSDDERADWFEAFLAADRLPQFGGDSFGWPPNRSMEVMYYNATWLKELGYDSPPTTPAEFVEMSCAAAEAPFSGNPDPSKSVGYQVRTDASSVASMAFASGVDIYDYQNNAFTYNTPELAAYMGAMAQLLEDGCASPIAERYAEQTDFGNGQTLFTMGSSSGLPFYAGSVDDGETDGFEWSVAPYPYTGSEPVQNIYGASVSIPRTDAETQLASFIFIKHFTSTDVQSGWVQASNYFPVRASVADGISDYFAENAAYGAAFDLLQYGKTEAPVAGYDNVRDEASAAYSRILDGEDPAEVLAELDEKANQILADAAPDEVMAPKEDGASGSGAALPMMDADPAVYGNVDSILSSGELDGTVVTWWHNHSGSREEYLQTIVDDFNAKNEYGIVVEAINKGGYGDIYDAMIAGITTGDVPGLVVAYQNQAAAYQVADGLVSLDPYIGNAEVGLSGAERADWFEAFLAADRLPQFGGNSFGWPPNRSMEVMYYNATWLKELGYDGPPTTPAEFVEMSCAAAEAPFSGNPDASKSVGYQVRTDASSVASMAFASGVDIYDYENNAFTYNTPELAGYMTAMGQLLADGCASLIAERYAEQTDFGNGQTLFTMGSSSGLPFYAGSVDDGETGGFEWSVAPYPYTGSEPVQNIYGASVSVPRTDPVTQLASFIFIKHFTTPDVQSGWVKASNYFPVRASVADGISDYFEENVAYGAAFDLLQYGKTEAPVAGYDNVRDEASAAYSRILDGEDAVTVLAELDKAANQILADAAP